MERLFEEKIFDVWKFPGRWEAGGECCMKWAEIGRTSFKVEG